MSIALSANYSYLADGTKLTASDKDGNGYVYMGSLVYRREDARQPFLEIANAGVSTLGLEDFPIVRYYYDLESTPFDGGRLTVSQVAGSNIYTPRYHSTDHLGSVRTVVDGGSGETVEKNDYDPFGSRIVDAENEISDNRYRYNGKEEQAFLKLPYLDYGARMYDSRIAMRWNRPDPLAEKYPGISPYAFCANNPINFVDPNGMDIWEVDEYGYIVNTTKDKSKDAFYMVDSSGNRLKGDKYSIEFAYGTVKDMGNLLVQDANNQIYNLQLFQFNDPNAAQSFFEIMSNNPANVEWSDNQVVKNDVSTNIVGTTHMVGMDATGGYLLHTGYTITEHTHNHPYTSIISDSDKKFNSILNIRGYAKTYIYLNNNYQNPFYQQYDSRGSVIDLLGHPKTRKTPWYKD